MQSYFDQIRSSTEYVIWMGKKDRRPRRKKPPADPWLVYMVRCADDSLYTGITKDVPRRCRQHNAGTASRYTRGRLPVAVVYQEEHPDHGSALRREAAIKALSRRHKESMIRLMPSADGGLYRTTRGE
jgi:predicted GIY-YIG superfamily endonuclease